MPERSRRGPSPFDASATPALEPIFQPIFGSRQIGPAASTPQVVAVFSTARGGTVDGINLAPHESNIQTPNVLPSPKTFLVQAIECSIHGLADNGADTAVGRALGDAGGVAVVEILRDAEELMFGSFVEFLIGSKRYARHPMFMFPCNRGVNGFGTLFDTADIAFRGANYTAGPTYNMSGRPIPIPPLLNFEATIHIPVAINTTPARRVQVILSGILGREVQ